MSRIDNIVPISEAKARLSELVHVASADGEDVVLLKHGKPAAVVVGAQKYQALLDRLEDLEDRVSVFDDSGAALPLRDIEEDDLAHV